MTRPEPHGSWQQAVATPPADAREPSSRAPEPTRELQAAARCAELLFLLAFSLAVATLALNRALSENRSETRTRQLWHEETGSMLGRCRAFRDRSPQFFEGLVFSALTRWPPFGREHYPNLAALVSRGPVPVSRRPEDGSVSSYGPAGGSETLLSELASAAGEFGAIAATVVTDHPDPTRRLPLLRAAVDKTFKNREAKKYLQDSVVVPLSRVDDMAESPWNTKAAWIVFGEWPPIGGSGTGAAPGTSYSDRFVSPFDAESERFVLYETVGGTRDFGDIERALEAAWRDAYARLKNSPIADPQIGVPGGGIALRATDIVMLGGPMLVVVQAFFAVFWLRHWSLQKSRREAALPLIEPLPPPPFVFPVFANPLDPLDGPIPKGVSEVTQRLTWLLFLVLPTAVLTVALLTRYDISTIDWLPPGTPRIARLLGPRRYDALSVFLDVMNVFGFLVSFVIIIEVTAANRRRPQWPALSSSTGRAMASIGGSLAMLVTLWAIILDKDGMPVFGHLYVIDLAYWLSIGVAWVLGIVISFHCRARLPLALSIVGLILCVAILSPH